jgi:SecD/SecF fusion protein
MQNKGLIKFFAIIFALVSIYQLSFTCFKQNKDDAKLSLTNPEKKLDI